MLCKAPACCWLANFCLQPFLPLGAAEVHIHWATGLLHLDVYLVPCVKVPAAEVLIPALHPPHPCLSPVPAEAALSPQFLGPERRHPHVSSPSLYASSCSPSECHINSFSNIRSNPAIFSTSAPATHLDYLSGLLTDPSSFTFVSLAFCFPYNSQVDLKYKNKNKNQSLSFFLNLPKAYHFA